MKYLILCAFVVTNCFAVTPIKKGEASKEDGYVFTKEEEESVREELEIQEKSLEIMTEKEKINKEIIDNQKKQLEIKDKQVKDLEDVAKDDSSILKNTGLFLLGVLTTVLIGVPIIGIL